MAWVAAAVLVGISCLVGWSLSAWRELRRVRQSLIVSRPAPDMEALAWDVRTCIAEPARLPVVCSRVCLATGAGAALWQGACALLEGLAGVAWAAGAALAAGVVGAVLCAAIGRGCRREGHRIRTEWKALMRRAAQDVAS